MIPFAFVSALRIFSGVISCLWHARLVVATRSRLSMFVLFLPKHLNLLKADDALDISILSILLLYSSIARLKGSIFYSSLILYYLCI